MSDTVFYSITLAILVGIIIWVSWPRKREKHVRKMVGETGRRDTMRSQFILNEHGTKRHEFEVDPKTADWLRNHEGFGKYIFEKPRT